MTEIDNVSDIKNEIKQALAKCNKTPWILTLQNVDLHYKAHEWITFLLSENTSLITTKKKEEIKKLSTCQDCLGTGTNELCHDPYYVVPCICTVDWYGENMELRKQIESLKAITELAVKGLKEISSMRSGGVDWDGDDYYDKFCEVEDNAISTLSEIARLQNDPIS